MFLYSRFGDYGQAMAGTEKARKNKRRSPSQARSREKVSFILEAAARILREEGSAGFNTNRIAERAGVSVGTLYGYFPDKEAILVALARNILVDDMEALRSALDGRQGVDLIHALVRALFERHRHDGTVRREVMRAHIGAGHGGEHVAQVQTGVELLLRHDGALFGGSAPPPDAARLFVVTRAVLGIARALAEEGAGAQVSVAEVEDETVALVRQVLERAGAQ